MSRPDLKFITRGHWRIRPAVVEGNAAVSYRVDGGSEVVAVETHADLADLRDAITEYLSAVEENR
jgi:hypothetical protein